MMRILDSMIKIFAIAGLMLAATIGQAHAGFVNGSFEDGLTGWTASDLSLVSVVSSYQGIADDSLAPGGPTFGPASGDYFATLRGGDSEAYTTLSQTFSAVAGQTLSGSAFFKANDTEDFNDDAYVKLIGANGLELFSSSVSAVDDYGSTPWTSFSHTFTVGGSFTLEAGVINILAFDAGFDSVLGLDAVQLSAETVPEPASVALWGLGAVGILIARRKRRHS
jgi:hypothetical protein